jgi:hypothetical protein
LVVVARTGTEFERFDPYVPAMAEDGRVAFQAMLSSGGSGVFVGSPEGGEAACVLRLPAGEGRVVSHPDVDGPAACCYVEEPSGDTALWLVRGGDVRRVAGACGPLGPTMAGGHVAYRAGAGGDPGVFVSDGTRVVEVDRVGGNVAGFEGLPVVTPTGAVAYRVNIEGGGHEIRLYEQGRICTIAATGPGFASLGRFPMINARHEVVFAATTPDGRDGLFVWRDGRAAQAAEAGDAFESTRGGLIGDDGTLYLIATPRGGGLGVFADAAAREPIIQVGMPLLGSHVTELALNPVSVNAAGQVAIRIALADGRGVIARSDSPGWSATPSGGAHI